VSVCDARPGVLTPLDLPLITGARQLRSGGTRVDWKAVARRVRGLLGVDRAEPRLQALGGGKRKPAASPAATFASRP
jgi:hypothetical protein